MGLKPVINPTNIETPMTTRRELPACSAKSERLPTAALMTASHLVTSGDPFRDTHNEDTAADKLMGSRISPVREGDNRSTPSSHCGNP